MSHFVNAVKAASVLAVLFVVACTDDTPTDFGDPSPAPAILDAVNGEDGNPFVFFKPPIVAQPSSDLFGNFNPDLRPVVEVCHLDEPSEGECEVLTTNDGSSMPARYTLDEGPGGESVVVDEVAEEYQVQIHFGLFDLTEGETYRIVVRVGAQQLAFADVTVVNPSEMRNADTGSNIVFTNDQKTVPLKVRIDDGAMCWDATDGAAVSCSSSTVQQGQEETVTLTSSEGEEVDFHLPGGWTATVDNELQTELTISIEEVPAQFGTPEDLACFNLFQLGDPITGEPANCYKVRADTDDATDVTVEFGGSLPILAFCPSADVLQAIADGNDGWIMTSVEEDQAGTTTRTYANVQPASDFGGCDVPQQFAMGDGPFIRLASAAWRHVKPIFSPLLPRPLHAADIGFGGSIDRLATIFFWSRTPVGLEVQPSPASVAVGSTLQLAADPIYHEGVTEGGTFEVTWSSDSTNVATVDGNGLVTGVAEGTTQITATATNLLDPSFAPVSGSTTLTVTPAPDLAVSSLGTVAVSGTDVSVDVTLSNLGGPAPEFPDNSTWDVAVYLSTDAVFDATDVQLGSMYTAWTYPVGNGWSESSTLSGSLPGATAPGQYHLIVVADAFPNQEPNNYPGIAESDETNNWTASAAFTVGVAIDAVNLSSTTLTIGGPNVGYTATVTNNTGATLSTVVFQAHIDQGAASRTAGGLSVTCGPTAGDLPTGTCTFNFTVLASNATAGSGTLVAGPATARFELIDDGVVLDTFSVPVTLE